MKTLKLNISEIKEMSFCEMREQNGGLFLLAVSLTAAVLISVGFGFYLEAGSSKGSSRQGNLPHYQTRW
ncbi:MAG: hypothetical protein U0X71_03050 [Sphingobacteriaceae bacterium]|jgi:hypothetical protein|nr:MAG: hypothetical protein E6Q66_07230 [Pedobacter sp.]